MTMLYAVRLPMNARATSERRAASGRASCLKRDALVAAGQIERNRKNATGKGQGRAAEPHARDFLGYIKHLTTFCTPLIIPPYAGC